MSDFKGNAQSQQRAQHLAKEREALNSLFKEKREALRKESAKAAVAVDPSKFVSAKSTPSAEARSRSQRLGLQEKERFAQAGKAIYEPDEEQTRRMQKAAAKLSFAAYMDDDDDEPEDVDFLKKKTRIGPNPNAYSAVPVEAEKVSAAEPVARKTVAGQPCRLILSYFDGTDHRFFLDCSKEDTVRAILAKAHREYGPLRGLLEEDLMLVKEGLILASLKTGDEAVEEWSLAEFERRSAGRAASAGRKPVSLFSFALQRKDHQLAAQPGTAAPEDLIDTDASRNARICSKAWYWRNRHLFPAKLWTAFDPSTHCTQN